MPFSGSSMDDHSGKNQVKEASNQNEKCDVLGKRETNTNKQTLCAEEIDNTCKIIIDLGITDEEDRGNNELVNKNKDDSDHNKLAEQNKDKIEKNQLNDKNEESANNDLADKNEGCSKQNKERSETNNKQTNEKKKETKSNENIDIIEIIDCDDGRTESEELNKNKEPEVIEIEDEGDDDELYEDIIETQISYSDSGSSSDEGIVVVFDRKENAVKNKEIIVVEEDDCENQIGKSATNLQAHFKSKRLNENISSQEQMILQEKIYCKKDKMWKDTYGCFMIDNRWFYSCHLCNRRGLLWWHLLQHIRKHNTGKNLGHQVFESTVCQIDNELSTINKPLVGLEYLLECVIPSGKPSDQENVSVYGHYCALCDETKFNRVSILAHLTSFQHGNTFLKKFFPTAYMKMQSYVAYKSALVRVKFLEHVIGRIEYIHGRLQPSQVSLKVFQDKKNMLRQKIEESTIHFWETPEQNFAACVSEAHIDSAQCKVGWFTRQVQNPNVDVHQPIFKLSSNFIDIAKSGTKLNNQENTPASDSKWSAQIVQPVKPFNHGQNLQTASSSGNFDLLERFDEEEKCFYEKLVTSQDSTLWEKYKQRIERIESDIIKDIDYYHENPEKHPQYRREFNNFYNRGKGKNKKGLPTITKFMEVWKNILTGMFQDVFKSQKTIVKKEFLENFYRSEDMHQYPSTSLEHPPSPQCSDAGRNNLQHKGGPYKRSYFPTKHDNTTCKRNKVNSEPTSTVTKEPENKVNSEPTSTVTKEPDKTRIISVLRYVAVLESHLGSLGFKVLNLLSKALSLEKSEDVTSILLGQQVNIILLCTVKEKLTGLLEANILEKSLIAVAENSIKKIETLLSGSKIVTSNEKNDRVPETPSCSDKLPNYGKGSKDCLKITEISSFIERHDKLSHLKFLEKTAIAQQVGSIMIVQNKLEISDKELMVLVYDTAKVLNLPLVDNESRVDDRPRENFERYSKSDSNESVKNIPGRANAYAKYPINQNTGYNSSQNYQDYQKNTNSFNNFSRESRFGAASSNTGGPQGYSRPLLPTPSSFWTGNIPGYVPGYIPPQRNFHRRSLPWSHNTNFK